MRASNDPRMTMETLLLDREQVLSCLSFEDAVSVIEEAFAAFGRGEAAMPAKVYLDIPEVGGDFRAMPARCGKYAGIKWVASHPENPTVRGLPQIIAVFILNDPLTALPLAIMDGTALTERRTGAAAAIASKYLASASKKLGFLGCGIQAQAILNAHRVVFGEDLEILAADRDEAAAARFAERNGGRVVSIEEIGKVDILNTTTPSRTPLIEADQLLPHTHINAIGADAPGKRELDASVLDGLRIVVDDVHQASHSGEINVPLTEGILEPSAILGNLGQIVAGLVDGRRGEGRSLFDSTGLAIQDVVAAAKAYENAKERGIGQTSRIV